MMAPSLKIVGLFVCLQMARSLGLIMLSDECPAVVRDPFATAAQCHPCLDCGFSPGSMCCPNKCGTHSCTFVRHSCSVGGKEYPHHSWMPLPNNYLTNLCGDCWCQNGHKKCITYGCVGGARP